MKQARKNLFEKLKMDVESKIIGVYSELDKIEKIIRDFDNKNSESGKPVFTKTVGFYLDGL